MPLCLFRRQIKVIGHSAGKVGMAAIVVIRATEQPARIGITARANHIMHRAAIGVIAIPVQRVTGDMRQGPHEGKARPEAVTRADMGAVQSACFAAVESLGDVVAVPNVQIPHLRPLHRYNPREMPGWHVNAGGRAGRYRKALQQFCALAPRG